MTITKRVFALLVAVLGAMLVSQPAFASGPPQPARGLVVITSLTPTSITHADGNTITEGTDAASITGTFSGRNTAHFRLIMHADGSFEDHEVGVFKGRAGTCGVGSVGFNAVVIGMPGSAPRGSVASRDLGANSVGIVFEVKLVGTAAGTVYSGTFHCTS